MTLLLLLLLSHLLADFFLQPNRWILCRQSNGWRSPALYQHAAVHGLVVLLLLAPLGLGLQWPAIAAIIATSHLLIDGIKSRYVDSLTTFIADQVAHLLVIGLLWLSLASSHWQALLAQLGQQQQPLLLLSLLYLSCLTPASVCISKLLSRWSHQSLNERPSLLAAGQTIGYLERLLIVSLILADQFVGVGFLLAAKSIFRFGDLSKQHDRSLTEYVMLGSLASVSWALVTGIIGRSALS
ncbi:DUF3307 domain-containing protein [Ferrimonas senticii]|uniref:DUF3307 domain-containing protein n=1 Tax=Ferrimonas senticii TaxID=394566 RepID=UPI0003FA57A5|nr:DUF3307 domain-containing protein [Ferrimonas senticii]